MFGVQILVRINCKFLIKLMCIIRLIFASQWSFTLEIITKSIKGYKDKTNIWDSNNPCWIDVYSRILFDKLFNYLKILLDILSTWELQKFILDNQKSSEPLIEKNIYYMFDKNSFEIYKFIDEIQRRIILL